MNTRFSKKALKIWAEKQFEALEKQWGFKESNGWNQVNGKGEEANRAYGQYSQLQTLWDAFGLGD